MGWNSEQVHYAAVDFETSCRHSNRELQCCLSSRQSLDSATTKEHKASLVTGMQTPCQSRFVFFPIELWIWFSKLLHVPNLVSIQALLNLKRETRPLLAPALAILRTGPDATEEPHGLCV